MPIPSLSSINLRLLMSLTFAIVLAAIIVYFVSFPSKTDAKLTTQVSSTKTSTKQRRPSFRPGKVLVRYRSESIAASRIGSLRITASSGKLLNLKVENFDGSELVSGLRIAKLAEGTDTLEAVAALREQPDVLYAEPNYIYRAAVTPNDTRFNQQTNMTRIGAPQAWDTQKGSTSVVVGVIDPGIDINHLDLQPNIWTNPQPGAAGGGISGDLHGYNFVDDSGSVFSGTDTETHASHVAGIIGAVGNNNKGVAGVNWNVGLMSLKFLDEKGFGDTENAIRACNYAKKMKELWETAPVHTKGANVRVLNASFGGAGFSQAFQDAINGLNTAGILFVAAAGNSTDDGTRDPDNDRVPHYPSGFAGNNVVAVAATDTGDAFANSFSHFGLTTVDLAAPGDTVLSTTPHCASPGPLTCQPTFTDGNGDTYTFFTGTSMSTPHVSGAAALLWAQNPNLTVQQVKNLLMLNGDVVPSLIDRTLTGRRLNIATSFTSLAENDSSAPGAVTKLHINSQIGRTFNLGWTASGDDSTTGQASLYQINFIDGGSGAVIPLKGVIPMASGQGQVAVVTIPFRHTSGTIRVVPYDNVGNAGTASTLAVGIPFSSGDPYTTSVGSPAALTSDIAIRHNINADDLYIDVALPVGFSFPLFGVNYTEVILSTNGVVYFGSAPPTRDDGTADDVPSSPGKLGGYRAIAGLWDDLDLRTTKRADAGVYQVNSPGKVIFRWQGVPCNYDGTTCTGDSSMPVNFEIELNSSGVIKTRYGVGNAGMTPTVGIGGGNQDAYFIPTHTSELDLINLGNAGEVTFTPRAATVSTIQLSQPTFNVNETAASVTVGVTRSGDTTSVATVNFATSDNAGLASCTTIANNASSRCDYITAVGSLTFAPGETSKNITVLIVNDIYTENPENLTVTLNNPIGATLGTTTSSTITISDGGTETGPNPIDNASVFVRQHYLDFLNREPDAGGLGFWTNEITSCGSDTQCIEGKRINVSAAFFLSIEFQETGYLVYRIYKSALGNLPPNAPVPVNFTNFLRDTQEIGKGVQVGIGDWPGQLESNKQAFTLAFVQRPEFLAQYPASMTATQIVDKMNNFAGVNILSAGERTTLINLLGQTPSDLSKRAAVLRAIAEDQTLRDAEFNKAFVLMQYFGYLRRSPNDFPDTNYDGFNFWLTKLNDNNGNYVQAEMVKAFIISIEYRQRFAP